MFLCKKQYLSLHLDEQQFEVAVLTRCGVEGKSKHSRVLQDRLNLLNLTCVLRSGLRCLASDITPTFRPRLYQKLAVP